MRGDTLRTERNHLEYYMGHNSEIIVLNHYISVR